MSSPSHPRAAVRISSHPSKRISGGTRKRLRVGELLVRAGKITASDLEATLAEQRRHRGRRVGEILVARGVISDLDLAQTLADEFDLPFVDLSTHAIDARALALVPADLVLRHHVLPIDLEGDTLVVAIADPLAFEAVEAVRFNAGHPVREVIASASQIEATIAVLLQPTAKASAPGGIDAILLELAKVELPADTAPEPVDEQNGAVIRLFNQILMDAYRRGASDVHIEPNGSVEPVLVRLRVDGECLVYHKLPPALGAPVVARAKIMAELDIAERRKPQDGKIRFRIGDSSLELRVATLPTVGGNEDVVLRLLPPSKPAPLDKMAFTSSNLAGLKALLSMPYGLILCVGPTGSGKTTTLHSALGALNHADVKIWTAEDPVEITQSGLRQVQINHKIGLDFATAMRSFLRADPDVIMVGEMRDEETARAAIEASLTGHLVLSTLHTNSAPETVVRLLDMGLDPFSFADSLLGILAQRLVRRLCSHCRRTVDPSGAERDVLARTLGPERAFAKVWTADGCEACDGTGYKGRMAIHELLVADDIIRAEIARHGSIAALRELSIAAGMRTLLQDGVTKVLTGDTDMRQVLAVCSR